MTCELCGKEGQTKKADIEGVQLHVCDTCSKLGKVIEEPQERDFRPARRARQTEERIVADAALRLRNKRENLGLTQEEFAKKVNERSSLLQRIENGQALPSLILAKKLEREFDLALIEEEQVRRVALPKSKRSGLTIGDLLKK